MSRRPEGLRLPFPGLDRRRALQSDCQRQAARHDSAAARPARSAWPRRTRVSPRRARGIARPHRPGLDSLQSRGAASRNRGSRALSQQRGSRRYATAPSPIHSDSNPRQAEGRDVMTKPRRREARMTARLFRMLPRRLERERGMRQRKVQRRRRTASSRKEGVEFGRFARLSPCRQGAPAHLHRVKRENGERLESERRCGRLEM